MDIENSDIRENVYDSVYDKLSKMTDDELETLATRHFDGYDEEQDLRDILLDEIELFDLADMIGVDVEGIRYVASRQLFEEQQDMMRLRTSYEYSR